MWSPMHQTGGKDHFCPSAGYPVIDTTQDVAGWHIADSCSICFSLGSWGLFLPSCFPDSTGIPGYSTLHVGLQLLLLNFVRFLLTQFPACSGRSKTLFSSIDYSPEFGIAYELAKGCYYSPVASWTLHCCSHFLQLGVWANFPLTLKSIFH